MSAWRSRRLRAEYPIVIDLQADLLSSLDTRVIAPLRRAELLPAIKRLNPGFTIDGVKVALVPTEIVAIRRSLLGPPLESLAKEHFAITAALDLMLTGIRPDRSRNGRSKLRPSLHLACDAGRSSPQPTAVSLGKDLERDRF